LKGLPTGCWTLLDASELTDIPRIVISERIVLIIVKSTLNSYLKINLPVESKGAANSLGLPFAKAYAAMIMEAIQNAKYNMQQKQSRHFRCSVGPLVNYFSRLSPLY
jgi:hypothetical protein